METLGNKKENNRVWDSRINECFPKLGGERW